MFLKNIFYNSYLALLNIKSYGFVVFFKSIFFEIYYSFRNLDFSFFQYDENDKLSSNYQVSKISDSYSVPNIPTPYFFLSLINKEIEKRKIKDFNLIDLGCGSGRLATYFENKFNIDFLGIDINKKIIENNRSRFKNKNYYFLVKDLKKIIHKNDLSFLDSKHLRKKLYIFYIADSIDAKSILKLLKILNMKFKNFIFIMVNQKNLKIFKNYKCFKKITFGDLSRNINFFYVK